MEIKQKKKFVSGMFAVIVSQAISILVSFILGFIVPKFIDEYQYSYWQTFLLYWGYIPLLNIGLLDGFALRYSQYDMDELDKRKVRSFFRLLESWMLLAGIIICAVSCIFVSGEYRVIFCLIGASGVVRYFWAYNYILFQTTDRMTLYAKYTIIMRAVYVGIIVLLLILRVNNFIWYCLAELIGEGVAGILSATQNRGLFLGQGIALKDNLLEAKLNIAGGFILLIANLASGFIVGGAKMVAQWHWDALTFGKLSFSFSLSNIFLTFVSGISVVLFPSLKRMKVEELPELYGKIRSALSIIFFTVIIAYFPLCQLLELWLPQYTESLPFLGILLPLTIFASKVSLLTNNYLKAFRKEKMMLIINFASVAIGFVSYLLCAYIFDNIDALLYCVVFTIMIRSIVTEIVVMKLIGKRFFKDIIIELIITILFMIIVQFLDRRIGCLVYLGVSIIYLLVNHKNLKALCVTFKRLFQHKKACE